MRKKIVKAKKAPAIGEIIQLATMFRRVPHFIDESARDPLRTRARPKPRTAPTIEWVVETGSLYKVARVIQSPAMRIDENAPIVIRCWSRSSMGTIPFAIVVVTLLPKNTAPENSRIPASTITCFIVRALLPTEVPIAFARSFAPIFHAIYSPATSVAITRVFEKSKGTPPEGISYELNKEKFCGDERL